MNTRSIILFVIGAIIVILAIVALASNRSTEPTNQNPQSGEQVSTTTPNPAAGGIEPAITYTLAQVATHNTATNCWAVIRDGVYDLTTWIKQHPGGQQAILGICGKDATAVFEAQHGGKTQPESALVNFWVGEYKPQ